jgi:hypothetical protein
VLAPISLRKHLRARLPEYMVPQYFLPMEEIPMTPNGKVDRRRLPIPVGGEPRQPFRAPATPSGRDRRDMDRPDPACSNHWPLRQVLRNGRTLACWPCGRCDKWSKGSVGNRSARASSRAPGGHRQPLALSESCPGRWGSACGSGGDGGPTGSVIRGDSHSPPVEGNEDSCMKRSSSGRAPSGSSPTTIRRAEATAGC